ncbi:MAG: response regulator [Oscillospiraceae bacterium]|nr:response regulator [Oscillospiraceae bacterium]
MGEKICILLAQSKKSNADFLSSALKKSGYDNIFCVFDGIDAVRMFEKLSPNVVFIDSALPLLDGISVLKKIKNADRDCIAAITSAEYSKAIADEFIKNGSDGFITEPFSEDRIIPWLIVSLAEKERSRKLKEEYISMSEIFNGRLDFERVVGKFASENSLSFEEAKKQLCSISESKNIPLEKLIEILK